MTLMPMPSGSWSTAGMAANAPRASGSGITVRKGMSTRCSAMRRKTPSIASMHAGMVRKRFTVVSSTNSTSGKVVSLVAFEEVRDPGGQQQVVRYAGDFFGFLPHRLELGQLALEGTPLL